MKGLLRAATAILWLFCVTLAAWAAAPPVDVTGASYAELDDRSGLWTLRGNPVTVRRGVITVRAPSITYDTRRLIVHATGGVSYSDESLSLEAPQITAWIMEERALAADRVVATQPRQNVRITAGRLEVFGKEQRLLATGSPAISSPDGSLSGDRIEAFGQRDEIVADGAARLTYEDIEGSAPRIVLRRRDGLAVFSGGAILRRGHNEVKAEVITADLRRRRVTANGQASITVHPER
jgi:lipopolysaccharide export system protein LptA